MNGLHFGIWLATTVAGILVLGIPAAISKNQSIKLSLCLLLGFIWATPLFAVFLHWLLSGTGLAFYTSASNRNSQTAGMRAFLSLILGVVLVHTAGSLAGRSKTRMSSAKGSLREASSESTSRSEPVVPERSNPSIDRTLSGKPASASHVKR